VRTVNVVVERPLAAAVKPPRAGPPPAAESLDTSGAAPVPNTGLPEVDTGIPEVVDGVLATVQGAVDGLPPASPAPAVPTPPALDPVQDAPPDPLPVSSKRKSPSAGTLG
jgi:hypothetical protein